MARQLRRSPTTRTATRQRKDTTIWQLLDVKARGLVLREQKDSIVTTYTYDNAGRMRFFTTYFRMKL
ncbi:MAG: hypothetical protein J6Y84_01675 [Bacteroidaceae bacterium]|nr:hypothetical protein [Bacteroidaceae bacterium]